MADTRILHKRGSHGERIVALSHLEYRVWVQYILSADDFGVMRASISVLQADNPRLEQETSRALTAALNTVKASGLVWLFQHQGVEFLWQPDWQDFQGIRYPRESVNPIPPASELGKATDKTRRLFGLRSETLPKDSGKVSEVSPHPARAGGRETLTLTLTPELDRSLQEESARETNAPDPAWNRNGRTPGLLANHHRGCFPSEACGRGICVPSWLATEWRQQHGTDTTAADVAIRGVIDAAVGVLPPGPIGDAPKDFWRAVWRAAHGSQAPTAGGKSKGQLTLDAARRFVLARVGAAS